MELKRVYPKWMLWKGGDPLFLVLIGGVWVHILIEAISKFLYGSNFQLPDNNTEIDHHMDEIWKVKIKLIGSKDKFTNFI